VLANSGTSPILMKNMPKRARSEADDHVEGQHHRQTDPDRSAIHGGDQRLRFAHQRHQSSPRGSPPSPPAVSSPGSRPSRRDWKVSAMSAPAQKPRPAPAMTVTGQDGYGQHQRDAGS